MDDDRVTETMTDDLFVQQEAQEAAQEKLFSLKHPKFKKFDNVLGNVLEKIGYIPMFGMLVMTFLTFADIICRLLFDYTIYGVYDWICFMMIPVGFLAIGYSCNRSHLVAVTLLSDKLPRLANKILDCINYIFTIVVTIIILIMNVSQAAVVKGLGTKALQFPLKTFWFYYVVALGMLIFLAVVIKISIKHIMVWRDEK